MKFALQLYTLREQFERYSFEEVLKKVAGAGFDGVEFAGVFGDSPDFAAKVIERQKLLPMGAHIGLDDAAGGAIEKLHKSLGLLSAAIPGIGIDDLKSNFDAVAAKLSIAAQTAAELNLPFYYHNHAHEFEGADYLLKLTDAVPGLKLEADIFWIKAAGYSPAEYFRRHGSRIGVLHVKELSLGGERQPNPVVGQGASESAEVLRMAKDAGHKWAVLEAENIEGCPFEYAAKSLEAMRGFVK